LFNFKIQQTHSSANFYAPTSQSNSASHLGLKISWPKITDNQPHQQLITQFLQTGCSSWRPTNTAEALKASNFTKQNTGSGPKPPDISVDGNTVESVNSLVYPGSLQSSDGQYRSDLTRRIGLDCGVMTSLKRIWSDKCLTFDTKLHIYQTPVLSQTPDVRTLHAFTISVWNRCLEYDGTTESKMMKYYNGPVWLHCPISYPVDASRYLGMWLYLTTTHWQTWLFSSTSTYHSTDLLTACGVAHLCPGNKWLNQLWNDSTGPIGDLCRRAVDHGHGGATTRRLSPAMQQWWW